ncbi:MAG: hypothetical protein CHACPFDD_03434 [Phycisphaerae bacterium]|nr:hypothetical protein [Phycisphaerae bacterium]
MVQGLTDLARSPLLMIADIIGSEAAMLATACWVTRRMRENRRPAFGLVPSGVSPLGYASFVLGSFGAAMIGVLLSACVDLFYPAGDGFQGVWRGTSLFTGPLLVIVISLAPGFCEELFLRGLLQRRLLANAGPPTAIAVSTLLFSLFHVDPHTVAFAAPIGAFLGIIAWRCGSVWPGVLCHAAVNGIWNIFFITATHYDVPLEVYFVAFLSATGAGAIGLAASFVLLSRISPPTMPSPAAHPPAAPPLASPTADAIAPAAPSPVAPPPAAPPSAHPPAAPAATGERPVRP